MRTTKPSWRWGIRTNQSEPPRLIHPICMRQRGLYSSVEDLYRWDQALATEQLVAKEVLDTIFTPYISIPPESNGEKYGYGWVIAKKFNHRWIGHEGVIDGYAAEIDRYPDDNVSIILLSNQRNIDLLGITS